MKNAKAITATIVIAIATVLVVFGAISMWQATFPSGFSQSCESLYNEYSATIDMPTRDALFQEGIDNGCFHYN